MNLLTKNNRKKDTNNDKIEFLEIIDDIISNETVQKMKNFRQHCNTSCYNHCFQVSYYSYWLAKKFNLDYVSTARAAMLHDLFLYDWREKYIDADIPGKHAFTHPKIALKNASQIFNLNKKEKDIIVKHMWPLTFSFPKYRESYIVNLMDKYSASKETYLYFLSNLEKNKIYKYAYIFLSLFVFRIT